jgi:hypothetical protein
MVFPTFTSIEMNILWSKREMLFFERNKHGRGVFLTGVRGTGGFGRTAGPSGFLSQGTCVEYALGSVGTDGLVWAAGGIPIII